MKSLLASHDFVSELQGQDTRALIKIVFPGIGNTVAAAIAAAGTWGIGEAAIAYFIEDATVEEAKRRFASVKKQHEEKKSSESGFDADPDKGSRP